MAHARGEGNRPAGGRGGRCHVLIADDHEDTRELFAEFLRAKGCDVTTASNGNEVLAIAKTKKPTVVVLDLGMPELDGWETTRALRAARETKDVAILVVSGHAHGDALDAARNAGCDEALVKPVKPDDLLAAIERWKHGRARTRPRRGSSKPPGRRLTIGELARRAGVGVETVRFYERKGLMPKAPRAGRRWRDYENDAVEQLRSIRRLRGLGFQTKEIAEILTLRGKPDTPCRVLVDLLAQKRDDLAVRIRELQASHAALEKIVAGCRRPGPLGSCRACLALFDPNHWKGAS